ncbi:hypothetical protein QR77_38760 [Streptomyces sp. 150FB]|nr:hypothetical protein QR77_38760 [Streptomyces sp. 150FB]
MAKPGSAAPSHRFTAPMATPYPDRSGAGDPGAETEERRTARNYQFTAYDIASGLVAVARGTSYAKAGQDVREHAARRWGAAVDGGARRHGTLVSDWVEVYAEALWQTQAPYRETWPETVLVGVLPLTADAPGGEAATRLVFSVFVAVAYGSDGRPAVFGIRTSTGTGARHWEAFLRELDQERRGRPAYVVGDGSAGLARAVALVWPENDGADAPSRSLSPALWTDEHLMRQEARRICRDRGLDGRGGRLWQLVQRAWRSADDWDRFTAEGHRHGLPELERWLARAEPTMARQFAARAHGVHRSRQWIRAALGELEERVGRRRSTFGNQARTDRLLRLMALDISGVARIHAWTDLICVWLERSDGRPLTSQRRIADQGGRRSLRDAPSR